MSGLRCQPWRALETIHQYRALSQTQRARIIPHSYPFASRAISSSSIRAADTPANGGTNSTTSVPRSSTTSTPRSAPSSTTSSGSRASPTPNRPTTDNISKSGLEDKPLELESAQEDKIDWTRSFHGLSAEPFSKETAAILLAETDPQEVEVKPDGILYLPEIKYRRILNRAFGPGGWGLAPRGESIVTPKAVTREYALVCHGR